jgi:hypothetical protein
MEEGIKYKSKDVKFILKTLGEISERRNEGPEALNDELLSLTKYPAEVIDKILKIIEIIPERWFDESMDSVLAYILIRINF